MKILLTLLILAGAQVTLRAQVVVQFMPELHGRTTDGLMWVKLSNLLQATRNVVLETTVSEKKAGKVLTIKTGVFPLVPGTQSLNKNAVSSASIQFASNNTARLVRQSAYFPEGEYEYCFRVVSDNKSNPEILGEQCFDYIVEPLTPLFLIEPYLKQSICDKRPIFTWQPSLPAIAGSQYRLTLAEIRPGQTMHEALVYNIPLINQSNITPPLLMYPPSARELEEGKKYSWQVTVYKDGVVLNRSEIWEFSIKCNDTPAVETGEGFRDIEDLAKGNFYIAQGKLLFAVYNYHGKTDLEYSFLCLNKPEQKIKRSAAIPLKTGNNNITIDLSDNKAFTDGYHYILSVKLPNGATKKLRFLFKSAS